uniref:GH3 domain containing n=1 Tax=Chrysemys picta bellii TaxID=8478 RepID=A0A8C3F7Z8_CHRPI
HSAAMLLAGLAVVLALLFWAWRCRPGGAGCWGSRRRPWGLVLWHWLALRVLGRAVGWQRRHLEQASKDVRRSQERLLLRLLGGAGAAEPGTGAGRRAPAGRQGLALGEGEYSDCVYLPWLSPSRSVPTQGPVLYLDVLSRVFPEALSPQGTARFSWARGCSLPAAAWPLPTLYCTPEEAGTVPSRAAALYVQLLFALRERELRALEAGLVSELYDALGVLRAGWEGLAQDLALGRLSPRLELPEGTRRRLEQGWDGVARRLWPRLQVVVAAEPSGEQLYGEALRESECQGLPFYCPFYALLGVNLWPEQPDSRYLLCPDWAFCEFLPAGTGAEGPPGTVLLADVQAGPEYELVLTAQAGLSRCPLSCHPHTPCAPHQSPLLRHPHTPCTPLSQTLSVRGEGVPEERFYQSLRRAVAMWPGARLVDYVCAESSLLGASSGVCAPHYQVFVELRGVRDLSEVQRYKLDQCLQEDFPVYKTFRLKGSIGPVRLHLVAAGAFRELRDAAGSPGPMARVLREKRLLHFIQRRVVS